MKKFTKERIEALIDWNKRKTAIVNALLLELGKKEHGLDIWQIREVVSDLDSTLWKSYLDDTLTTYSSVLAKKELCDIS